MKIKKILTLNSDTFSFLLYGFYLYKIKYRTPIKGGTDRLLHKIPG